MIDVEALKAKVDLTALVGHFVKLEKAGTEWKGLCPFHADKNPSFYVSPVKGFCHCFACGANHDAISFVQEIQGVDFKGAVEFLDSNPPLQPHLSKPERPPLPDRVTSKPPADAGRPNMAIKKLGDPSMVWEYKDTDGGTLGYVARYETEEGKEIRCFSWGTRGSDPAGWACGHFNRPRPPYGLDRIGARPSAPVLIVEGEKACDAAQKLLPGYVCITWPGGAQAWKHADLTVLRGKTVLLWPDCDEPGIKAMQGIASVIADPNGTLRCMVRIIDPSGMPDGYDAADWTGTTEELIAWAKPRASDYTHKSLPTNGDVEISHPPVEISHLPESSAAQTSPAGFPFPPAAAPSLGPPTGPTSDEPPAYTEAPPVPGTLPEPPAGARKRPSRRNLSIVDGNAARKPAIEDSPDLPAALTENGSAARFARMYADDFRVIHEWGGKHGAAWLAWDDTRWVKEPTRLTAMQRGKAFAAALRYHEDARTLTELSKQKFDQKKYITSFLDLAQSDERLVAKAALFDADAFLLGTPGGTVDLRTGKLIEAEREHLLTRQTTVTPAPGPHPLFDSVINCIAGDDATLRAYVWKALGYSITGDQREENFWFLYGKPQSGKTTLIEAVAAILGNAVDGGYAATCDMDLFTETKHDRGNERMAELSGARFVYASETEEGRNWKAALLKLAVGGDTLRGRMLYENSFSFRPTHHIWIFGNSRPHLKSKDDGIKRRLHLLEYPGVISNEERDNTLKARLVAEYPAILHSMILACLDWQNEGLGKPESVSHATETYLSSEDTLQIWLDECCERDQRDKVTAQIAYASFRQWAEKAGEFVLSQKRFSAAMEDHGIAKARSATARYFIGLRIKSSDDDRAPPSYFND